MLFNLLFYYIYDIGFLYQLVSTLSVLLLVQTAFFYKKRHKRYQLFNYYGIPGPHPTLLSGSMQESFISDSTFLKDVEWATKYGKVYGIFIGDEPSVVLSDVNLLKKVFIDNTSVFKERSNNFLETNWVHSVLFAPFARWKFMRKILSPPFSAYTVRGDKSTQFIENSIGLMINYIDNKLKGVERAEIDLHDLMKATSLHLVNEIAVQLPDIQVKEREEHVINLDSFMGSWDKGVIRLAIMFPLLKPFLQFFFDNFELVGILGLIHKKVDKTIDDQLSKLNRIKNNHLDTHQNKNEDVKILTSLIKMHYEKKLTRREIMGNVEAILFAGYDTTSTTLTYIFWVLGKYPEIQEKLRADLLINGAQSKYLEQVIKETMRMYPIVLSFTTRLASENFQLTDELIIPKGTRVIYNGWLMHRDPELWPEPDKFEPERFREGVEIHPCAYAPFGMGHRKCLGMQLACLEMRMIVCDIIIRYKIHLKSPKELNLVTYSTTLSKPKNKVMVELEKFEF